MPDQLHPRQITLPQRRRNPAQRHIHPIRRSPAHHPRNNQRFAFASPSTRSPLQLPLQLRQQIQRLTRSQPIHIHLTQPIHNPLRQRSKHRHLHLPHRPPEKPHAPAASPPAHAASAPRAPAQSPHSAAPPAEPPQSRSSYSPAPPPPYAETQSPPHVSFTVTRRFFSRASRSASSVSS